MLQNFKFALAAVGLLAAPPVLPLPSTTTPAMAGPSGAPVSFAHKPSPNFSGLVLLSSPSFGASVSVPSSDYLKPEVSHGSSDAHVPSQLFGIFPPTPKSVTLHVDVVSDVNPGRMSGVCSSQAVNLPCSETVPISDDAADFANVSLLGASDSKPPMIADASPPRAS
ncbi:hypothetical protein Nepgr_007355 [Nepenthes gracilis]|uniref:Uncharacterized protein n=1 Tax=Nepenthes gracilis TaxID=150966 RepID=A0AAD3S6T8_NEPGR|nr:hypothetical protein Nepgr_007355 [Nepenthes gracilis]